MTHTYYTLLCSLFYLFLVCSKCLNTANCSKMIQIFVLKITDKRSASEKDTLLGIILRQRQFGDMVGSHVPKVSFHMFKWIT